MNRVMRLMNRSETIQNLKRKSTAEKVIEITVSAIFMVVALSYLYILVWTFLAAVRTHTEIVMNPFGLPEKWNWRNFIDMFQIFEVNGKGFFHMLFNSIYFSTLGELVPLFTACTFSYCCTKYKFPGSTWPYSIIFIKMTLPIYGAGGALYKVYYNLGFVDTYAQIFASFAGFTMTFLYFRAYYLNISNTYMEAAKMDGADDFQTYFHVMLPLAKPLFGALFLTQWMESWNNYSAALVYLPNLPTLPVGIYQFNTEMVYQARLDILFAACLLICIPAIVLFAVFNKTITTNVSLGGIKG